MKICPNCGAEVKDDKKFCPKCGNSLKIVSNQNKESNNKLIIIAIAVVICIAIIGATYFMISNDDSTNDVVVINNSESNNEDSVDSSSSQSSSDSSESINYEDALAMYSDEDSVLITNAYNEAESSGDDLLTGSEITEFKRLAKLGIETGSVKYAEAHQEHGAITRYCTTHGRVTTGEDLKCPYCKADGLDPTTVKGSTEYN